MINMGISELQRRTPADARGMTPDAWRAKHGAKWDPEEIKRHMEAERKAKEAAKAEAERLAEEERAAKVDSGQDDLFDFTGGDRA